MKTFTLIWSFRNRLNVLIDSILTADKYFPKNVNFCLVDAGSNDETIRDLRFFANTISLRKIRICESIYRTNLSEAWNLGMMLSQTDFYIFSSSDVVFKSEHLFNVIENCAKQNVQYLLIDNHAVFMLNKEILSTVGWFDEAFVHGPHFDTDYMIRASEKHIAVHIHPNQDFYTHGDTEEETIIRTTKDVPDRLPMNDLTNEKIFKSKWKTDWPGWKDYANVVHKPHPPIHISQVKRLKEEINYHPNFVKK